MNDDNNFMFQLVRVSNLLEEPINLENGLAEAAKLTAQILRSQRCSIMLFSDESDDSVNDPYLRVFTHYGNLPTSAYAEVTKLNEGIAGYVAATREPLLIKDLTQSKFVTNARYLDEGHNSLMSVPIILSQQVVGVINVSIPLERPSFVEDELDIVEIFALFVGKSLQIAQLQTIMRSKFVEVAVIRDVIENNRQPAVALHSNPTKLAKIVAKSFYKELAQAGFSPNQVIASATEVLNLLQDSLERHKKRIK
ncbi:GAF domain-containing protein [Aphanothece sacrum]|uniref:Serine phosphatase n=1 Tax=Aphanothece sacrum FPU1 TaxID=1920663 RepID=A0A401IEM2_APHSA|nr:GAF domain-containing protein [Aphanothece sacrum]GBF79630.1 serine phosphatase [Aphanothece sacrum FPU1]GBF87090.1 serine phosphatase [Aphanothece sacrum FPU3]